MNKEKESELIMISARWEAICDILEGEKASDFMLSFPEVRHVADLYLASQQANAPNSEGRSICDQGEAGCASCGIDCG